MHDIITHSYAHDHYYITTRGIHPNYNSDKGHSFPTLKKTKGKAHNKNKNWQSPP